MSSKDFSVIDLFCGVGGLSYGINKAGCNIMAGIDSDKSCEYAFTENIKADFLTEDITKVEANTLLSYWGSAKYKILVGCAPCQPFSKHTNKRQNKEQDTKWSLINEFLRLIKETKPCVVSMENVPNLAKKEIFENFVYELRKAKYFVSFTVVNCKDYGIPQTRRRLVLLASKFGKIEIIDKTHNSENQVTLKDAIGFLPPVKSGEVHKSDPLHKTIRLSDLNMKRMKASKPKGTWLDWDESLRLECHKKESGQSYKAVYGRLSWDEPSVTITTKFYNYGTGRFGHPEQDRALTLREGALLQTFPLDYKFYEDEERVYLTSLGRHIGNAVPVKLGEVIGKSIINHINLHS